VLNVVLYAKMTMVMSERNWRCDENESIYEVSTKTCRFVISAIIVIIQRSFCLYFDREWSSAATQNSCSRTTESHTIEPLEVAIQIDLDVPRLVLDQPIAQWKALSASIAVKRVSCAHTTKMSRRVAQRTLAVRNQLRCELED
jgi:hypothetical protein